MIDARRRLAVLDQLQRSHDELIQERDGVQPVENQAVLPELHQPVARMRQVIERHSNPENPRLPETVLNRQLTGPLVELITVLQEVWRIVFRERPGSVEDEFHNDKEMQNAHEGYWHGGSMGAIGMAEWAKLRIMQSGRSTLDPGED